MPAAGQARSESSFWPSTCCAVNLNDGLQTGVPASSHQPAFLQLSAQSTSAPKQSLFLSARHQTVRVPLLPTPFCKNIHTHLYFSHILQSGTSSYPFYLPSDQCINTKINFAVTLHEQLGMALPPLALETGPFPNSVSLFVPQGYFLGWILATSWKCLVATAHRRSATGNIRQAEDRGTTQHPATYKVTPRNSTIQAKVARLWGTHMVAPCKF